MSEVAKFLLFTLNIEIFGEFLLICLYFKTIMYYASSSIWFNCLPFFW